ncbi:collagen-binding domain-containing protein [Propionivibrio soli]|uniref:collagen-binding domain-containing protein n=1 Tax=Propionivibrio soli TaxID=2976531 RepID=UPI0021E7C21C|nr:collagen-binding domain-containing protein [Propionivibrio soli]
MKSILHTSVLALAALTLGSAHAAPITAQEALNQFNLVVFGDSVSSSHVDGRTYVRGNLTGGDYVQHPADTPASGYSGVTVGGNASSLNVNGLGIVTGGNLTNTNVNSGSAVILGNASNVNFNGAAYVGGTASNSNFNGGHLTGSTAVAAQQNAAGALDSSFLQVQLNGLSQQLSQLASTGSNVTINGGRAVFNAVADANGLAVFDLTLIDTLLFTLNEFEFNLNGATTLIFNSDNAAYDIHANFLGGSARTIGKYAIWNFYNAANIALESEFGGAVLGISAALRNENNIEGTVVVASLQQHGEIHLQPFTGDVPDNNVPEPESLGLLIAGLAAMAYPRLRRPASSSRRDAASNV